MAESLDGSGGCSLARVAHPMHLSPFGELLPLPPAPELAPGVSEGIDARCSHLMLACS